MVTMVGGNLRRRRLSPLPARRNHAHAHLALTRREHGAYASTTGPLAPKLGAEARPDMTSSMIRILAACIKANRAAPDQLSGRIQAHSYTGCTVTVQPVYSQGNLRWAR